MTASPQPRVHLYVASFNTAASTELCIRSIHRYVARPFALTVGDSGSSDGSLEMLRDFEQRGWLTLDLAPGGRKHAAWLDHWIKTTEADRVVFIDSDVEFRRPSWLGDLLETATHTKAVLICGEVLGEEADYVEPVSHRRVRLAARPSPSLLMIDPEPLNQLDVSFAFEAVRTDRVPEGMVLFDVAGAVLREIRAHELPWAAMPPAYRSKYRHYGGLSWLPWRGRRGLRKALDLGTIRIRLMLLRMTQDRRRLPGKR